MLYTVLGLCVYAITGLFIWYVRPKCSAHSIGALCENEKTKALTAAVCITTILLCIIPMKASPVWNGEIPGHRNQYELMADSILNGHISFDYEVDEKLLSLDNPYDPDARKEAGVSFHWDHAFYNGKYYMYFGVVPVFLVFIPFKLITGSPLTTYHATQLFVALFIIGIFMLFRLLTKIFFKNLSRSVYLLSSVALSVASVWYVVGAPALYCTAISSAFCLEIWSLFFFIKAAYETETDTSTVIYSTIGALFGALAFGCRPPVALANLIVIPLAIPIIKKFKRNWSIYLKIFAIITPYIVIGILLMVYNYVRFDNPFEFGQSYQLTVADQSKYGNIFKHFENMSSDSYIDTQFSNNTILFSILNYLLILPFSLITLINKKSISKIKNDKLCFLIIMMIVTTVVIILSEILFSPYYIIRYCMDFAWILSIICFILMGVKSQMAEDPLKYSRIASLLCFSVLFISIIMFLIPNPDDKNITCYVDVADILKSVFTLGIL